MAVEADQPSINIIRAPILVRIDRGIVADHQAGERGRIKDLLEENGYQPIMICAMEITPETLESFTDLEGYVEISCPRISTDDQERYRKPILNPEEVMVAIGKKKWEDYTKGMTLEEWH